MIRVNLLRNRVGEGTTATSAASVPSSVSTRDNSALREAVVRLAFISLFTVAMMVFENQHIRGLNEQRAHLTTQFNQLTAEAATKAADVDSVKDIEVQAKELEDKLKILKLLSRLRLREVKTLDFMQSSIPEKVWLKAIHYESAKDHLEQGHFSFEGGAVATEELTEFVKRLENSAYLADVIVLKNLEVAQQGKGLPMREFQFSAEVEQQN